MGRKERMKIKLWGVRGSLPTPMTSAEYRDKLFDVLTTQEEKIKDPGIPLNSIIGKLLPELKYVLGGETTCVEVLSNGTQLILDMGSGARRLGYDMAGRGEKKDIHILFTHTHWDHIQGWPSFLPATHSDQTIHFYSCLNNLKKRFIHQQKKEYSDISFQKLPCKKIFHHIKPGENFEIAPFHITTQPLIHPGGSISYKIEAFKKTFIFATDTEFYGPQLSDLVKKYHDFFYRADMMIMDAQYSMVEAEEKKGWGHTAMTIAVDCSIHWKVKKLLLTHHEPDHTDKKIYEIYNRAIEYLKESRIKRHKLQVLLARQDDVHFL